MLEELIVLKDLRFNAWQKACRSGSLAERQRLFLEYQEARNRYLDALEQSDGPEEGS